MFLTWTGFGCFLAEVKTKILSSGIIPYYRDPTGLQILILRNYKNWDFPKGVLDPGEDPIVGAKRELFEETGISKVEFPLGLDFYETQPYGSGKVARYHIGEVFSKDVVLGINPEIGRAEHDEFRWVSLEKAPLYFKERVGLAFEWAFVKLNKINY